MAFVNRLGELAALERFWNSGRAECIPVIGRRRVGKTALLEQFAAGKTHVYYRCRLAGSDEQLPLLGRALAERSADSVVRAQPPTTWEPIFALIEQYARQERFLLVLDEIPYWVAKHDQVPSVWQNWWDATGRYLPGLMLVLCGSAVQMMEQLFSGDAPLAGCVTGRLPVVPFTYRQAAELLTFPEPVDTLTAYGILGGIPLYLTFFDPARSVRDNIAAHIVSPTARLHVEPQAVFASHHKSFDAQDALRVLGAIAGGARQWGDIVERSHLSTTTVERLLDLFRGDLALVRKVLPVTVERGSRTTRTLYRIADNYFRFWFTFIDPYRGRIEFGGEEAVADTIIQRLPEYMGEPFEDLCRDWVRTATGAARVGTWWAAKHELDVIGLDAEGAVAVLGECKWQNSGFGYDDLTTYLGHVTAFAAAEPKHPLLPDVKHILFSKTTFAQPVQTWANRFGARLLTPADLLA